LLHPPAKAWIVSHNFLDLVADVPEHCPSSWSCRVFQTGMERFDPDWPRCRLGHCMEEIEVGRSRRQGRTHRIIGQKTKIPARFFRTLQIKMGPYRR